MTQKGWQKGGQKGDRRGGRGDFLQRHTIHESSGVPRSAARGWRFQETLQAKKLGYYSLAGLLVASRHSLDDENEVDDA